MLTRQTITSLTCLLLLSMPAFSQPVRVEIDAANSVRAINPWLYGINTARWDESLFPGPADEMLLTADRDAIAKIKASGVTLLKYPGGNDADGYLWNSPSNNATEMNTDEYIALCRAVGAEPFITVNFNEPPELAAAWIRYCNVTMGYHVKLWEVGDEQWGTWARGHVPPEEYAKKYIGFVKAMRSADPTIKVATNVPLGTHPENWAERVMKAAGDYVDMVTFTYFPQQFGKENDDTLMTTVGRYREAFIKLRKDIERAVGPQKASSLMYINVGYNSVNHSPGPQTLQMVNALWTGEMLGSMAELGTDIACFWALHNFYPPRGGDFGYMSSDGSNTPYYSYYVFPLFAQHLKGNLLETRSSSGSLSVYASRAGRSVSLILINKEKQKDQNVDVLLRNFQPQNRGRAWILDEHRKYQQIAGLSNVADHFSVDVPPYSIMAVELIARDSILMPGNLAMEATATASSYSTIGPHFKPASAVDGKLSTRWNSAAWTKSNGQEEQWFQLSWDRPQRIGFVRIQWGESRATDYRLASSSDGRQWTTIRDVSGGRGNVDEFSFTPHEVRFLKIDGHRGTKGISAYSIREIEVYERPPVQE